MVWIYAGQTPLPYYGTTALLFACGFCCAWFAVAWSVCAFGSYNLLILYTRNLMVYGRKTLFLIHTYGIDCMDPWIT
jgi:hypothetical protein